MLAGTWFHASMTATNVVQIRMFNGGTSAANPPSMYYRCALNYYDE
jgi:hypothetical protein